MELSYFALIGAVWRLVVRDILVGIFLRCRGLRGVVSWCRRWSEIAPPVHRGARGWLNGV